MVNPSNFLDLYDIFVNELIGDVLLAIVVVIIVIVLVSTKKNMTPSIIMMSVTLAIMIYVAKVYDVARAVFAFSILAGGAIFYAAISKIMRRG